jgi:type IV fimbrial biogenesis protein FimT
MIVVMVVAAIIMGIAVPSFKAVIKNNHLATEANNFVAALNFARAEAVSRGDRVTVCRSLDGASCDASSGEWENGWIVFQDTTASGTEGTVDGGDTLLRVYDELSGDLTLRTSGSASNYLTFNAQGEAQGGGGLSNDSFDLCDSRGVSFAYNIAFIATGRVSSSKPASVCP